jgi:hypothetical protein
MSPYDASDGGQEKSYWRVVDGTRRVLVRSESPASWEPQEEGMMSIAASFPSVKKPRFISFRREKQTM